MTYELIIADRAFSSWSLRGWLMFARFGIECDLRMAGLYSGTFANDMAAYAPARLVPALRLPEGTIVGDTLAIAETLAERHPEAGLWPEDPADRARARWLAAEMHSGFTAIRADCPMQLLCQYRNFEPAKAVLEDLDRLQVIWASARSMRTSEGPWLLGRYSLADVFFAPMAARIVGYGLPLEDQAAADYVDLHIGDPTLRAWRQKALEVSYDVVPYALDLPRDPWPG